MGDIYAPLIIFSRPICTYKATLMFFYHPIFICNYLERLIFGTIFLL